MHINPLLEFYSYCALSVIEYSPILSYSSITDPLTLDTIKNPTNQSFKSDSITTLRYKNCSLTLIALPGKDSAINFAINSPEEKVLLHAINSIHLTTTLT